MAEIRRLHADTDFNHLSALAAVLLDCVEGGASVGFVFPFLQEHAEEFYRRILEETRGGGRILLAAFEGPDIVGTAQLVFASMPNQTHRADVAKLLVRRAARGRGIASQLMAAVESHAHEAKKTLLVLDTATGSEAERLYASLGWTQAGVIPDYATWPDGSPCATTIFWKSLDRQHLQP